MPKKKKLGKKSILKKRKREIDAKILEKKELPKKNIKSLSHNFSSHPRRPSHKIQIHTVMAVQIQISDMVRAVNCKILIISN